MIEILFLVIKCSLQWAVSWFLRKSHKSITLVYWLYYLQGMFKSVLSKYLKNLMYSSCTTIFVLPITVYCWVHIHGPSSPIFRLIITLFWRTNITYTTFNHVMIWLFVVPLVKLQKYIIMYFSIVPLYLYRFYTS